MWYFCLGEDYAEDYADLIGEMQQPNEDGIYDLPEILFQAIHENILTEGFSWDLMVWVSYKHIV